jgi:hypothetical protein
MAYTIDQTVEVRRNNNALGIWTTAVIVDMEELAIERGCATNDYNFRAEENMACIFLWDMLTCFRCKPKAQFSYTVRYTDTNKEEVAVDRSLIRAVA